MFGEEKHLKDTTSSPSHLQGEGRGEVLGSYTKTHKLITALYMVTDIIDKDEPLRNKLRTLGAGIISDMHLVERNSTGYTMSFIGDKIAEIMSFLSIASTVNIISEMNCNILRKEFSELNQSILEAINKAGVLNRQINISEFLADEFPPLLNEEGVGGGNSEITTSLRFGSEHSSSERRRGTSKGHVPTRAGISIGVQKGSTLLKALKQVSMSNKKVSVQHQAVGLGAGFEALKKERSDSIVNIIRAIGGGATIKDIKDKIKTMPGQASSLVSFSEKTLQRELISMVKNGVLNKTGEKRWSRYFIK